MFISDDKLSLQFYESTSDSTSHEHRVDMDFNKGNSDKKIYSLDESRTYTNFSGGAIPDFGRERLAHINATYSPEVWSDIDMMYASNASGPKVYYICKPGFSTANVTMDITGHDGLSIEQDGSLRISNSVEDLILLEAEVYQIASNGTRIDLAWDASYSISGNIVSLSLGSFSSSLPLVVELDKGLSTGSNVVQVKNLKWSSFLGGTYNDISSGIVSTDDNVWVVGGSKSGLFINSPGQIDLLQYTHPYVAKFDSETAELAWVTAIQGELGASANGIDVNPNNSHVFIAGATGSDDLINFSTVGLNDMTLNGSDGFIIELKIDGTRNVETLQTYIGGAGVDRLWAIDYDPGNSVDPDQKLVVVGTSNHFGGLWYPLVNDGGYFDSSTGSNTRGVITKLGTDMTIEWSTFFGGENGHICELTDVDILNNQIFIAGKTNESNSPLTCSNPTLGRLPLCDTDGEVSSSTPAPAGFGNFLAEFDGSSLVWSTYIGGGWSGWSPNLMGPSIAATQIEGIEVVYYAGSTSTSDFSPEESPVPGAYNYESTFDGTPYLAKYVEGQLTWSTNLMPTLGVAVSDIEVYQSGPLSLNGVVLVGHVPGPTSTNMLTANCIEPDFAWFPTCDSNGEYYIEGEDASLNGRRQFIMYFSNNQQLEWSTLHGTLNSNSSYGMTISGDNLYTVGQGQISYTLEEFDENSDIDYYRTMPSAVDATISLFNLDFTVTDADNLSQTTTERIMVWPNPGTDIVHIEFLEDYSREFTLNIYNSMGALVHIVELNRGQASFDVDIGQLLSGIYLLEIQNDLGQRITSRLIKD